MHDNYQEHKNKTETHVRKKSGLDKQKIKNNVNIIQQHRSRHKRNEFRLENANLSIHITSLTSTTI